LSDVLVRAAGGVVARDEPPGREIVVVHRPEYDDWTLPKGKALPGEADEDCALREVWEETGLHCELGQELGRITYRDSRGRRKIVRYWLMRPVDGVLRASNEVDEARWLSLPEAGALLTYERDREILGKVRSGG
jgi:8-oxo-dGTP diphosphatase